MKYVSRLLEAILGEYIGFFPAIVMLGPSQTRNLRIDERATAMRSSQKRLQVIWIITFLAVAIPLSAFLAA
jgi:hypothetical protein